MTSISTKYNLSRITRVATAFFCLTAMGGCEMFDSEECDGPVEVKFSMRMGGPETRAVETQWSPGDQVGIFMFESGQPLSLSTMVEDGNNKRYVTASGDGNFEAYDETNKMYYPENGDYVDFISYYPYRGAFNNFIYKIEVSDQSDTEKIDLLYSNNARHRNKNNPVVPLIFSHRLSNLIFNFSAGGLLTEADLPGMTLRVSNMYLTSDFDLKDGSITPTGGKGIVTPHMSADGKRAEAIVIPVPAAQQAGRRFTFKPAGYDELPYEIGDDFIFESGFQYTFEVTVYHDKVEITKCDIEDWTPVQVYDDDLYTPNGLGFPNCYIVPPGGEQEIPALKAFAVWTTQHFLDKSDFNPKGTITPGLVWEEHQGLITGLSVTGESKAATITVKTASGKTGNAVVGGYIDGILRWSWHIWVTDYDPAVTNHVYNNGYETTKLMDRNLGAVANDPSVNRLGTYGMYYQWGRKDPFPGPDAPTGDRSPKFINVYGPQGQTLTVKSEYIPAAPNFDNSIFYPLTFYWGDIFVSGSGYENEWYSYDREHNYNFLWTNPTGTKGVYDPCPEGWRVPVRLPSGTSPWHLTSAGTSSPTHYGTTWNYGYNFTASHYQLGWYPAGGTITSSADGSSPTGGVFRDVGVAGYYSMATHRIRQADMLRISNGTISTMQVLSRRTYGMNIRCVADK